MTVAAFDICIDGDHDIRTRRGKVNCISSGFSCQDLLDPFGVV